MTTDQANHLLRKEILGPVITIQSFSSEEAIAMANRGRFLFRPCLIGIHRRCGKNYSDYFPLEFGKIWINDHLPLASKKPAWRFQAVRFW